MRDDIDIYDVRSFPIYKCSECPAHSKNEPLKRYKKRCSYSDKDIPKKYFEIFPPWCRLNKFQWTIE